MKATMSREVLYEDGSGPRCKVVYQSDYRLGREDDSYVNIQAVGGSETDGIQVNMKDVDMLIDALKEAQALDRQCRIANSK
jgi:hypothetical protein